MIGARPAPCTLYELQTVYSVEDAYDMLEVLAVTNHNEAVANARNH